ncbi:MAG: peptidoglycan DD-metalloendopeptidase family protein [Cytophagales bacterium]|nr:peptidoglycan DD-metalloendopeptidase family protein [Cytophagales bacterium]
MPYLPRLAAFAFLIFLLNACHQDTIPNEVPITAVDTTAVVTDPTLLYGFPVDSFQVTEKKVKWNESISDILSDYNIHHRQIFELANKAEGVYDVRRFKAGYKYTIISEGDSLNTARQMIFEPDNRSYVVFNLADSIYVDKVDFEVKTVEREIAGEVTSSVYQTIVDAGSSPILVNKLVDVFAWQVDFFRIPKGDKFKVIYEEERIGDKIVGIGKVKGAYFKHFDKEYYAIYYDQKGQSDYFDEEGNSLRKTFLRAPLNFTRISSRYSPRRFHPVQKRYKAHLGTDYAAPVGTPIRTVGDGVVLEARYGKYNGNFVKIKHNSNYTTQYLHMSKIARGIKPGQRVKQGQTIGFVGSTGLARGPHLCFRFWKNGRQVDALKVDLPPTEPIITKHLANFLHAKNVMLHRLDLLEWTTKKELVAGIAESVNTNE